eukprot:Gb_41286 [translate_table: standard]
MVDILGEGKKGMTDTVRTKRKAHMEEKMNVDGTGVHSILHLPGNRGLLESGGEEANLLVGISEAERRRMVSLGVMCLSVLSSTSFCDCVGECYNRRDRPPQPRQGFADAISEAYLLRSWRRAWSLSVELPSIGVEEESRRPTTHPPCVACQSLGPLSKGGGVVGVDVKVHLLCSLSFISFTFFEQKVKVPSTHCDERVQTVCGDVMKLMFERFRALSPQVKHMMFLVSMLCIETGEVATSVVDDFLDVSLFKVEAIFECYAGSQLAKVAPSGIRASSSITTVFGLIIRV